ncbi:MAG: hypothetical protein WCV99_14995 [Sterolibacterium sp.]|jgi:hypothetical protein
MNLIRLMFTALLLAAGAFGAAQAEDLCGKSANPLVVEYPGGGNISLSYRICITDLRHPSLYWESNMTYNNVSFDGTYQINGTVDMRLDWASDAIGALVFRNGPLTFTVGGKSFDVVFNDLAFNFNDKFQLQNTTGSLTINGVTATADNAYLAYLLR